MMGSDDKPRDELFYSFNLDEIVHNPDNNGSFDNEFLNSIGRKQPSATTISGQLNGRRL